MSAQRFWSHSTYLRYTNSFIVIIIIIIIIVISERFRWCPVFNPYDVKEWTADWQTDRQREVAYYNSITPSIATHADKQ